MALVEGATISAFGVDSCLERIVEAIEAGTAFDMLALRITATSDQGRRHPGGVVLLNRPNFDLAVAGLS